MQLVALWRMVRNLMNSNPLFIEYYPHTKSDCYKIRIPWTKYKSHTVVICEVSEGLAKAKKLAARELLKQLADALEQPLANVRHEPRPTE